VSVSGTGAWFSLQREMDEENGYSGSSSSNLETLKAERSVWLMKCPLVVSKSWETHPPSQPLAKVVLSLDPLHPEEDPSAVQVLHLLLFHVLNFIQFCCCFLLVTRRINTCLMLFKLILNLSSIPSCCSLSFSKSYVVFYFGKNAINSSYFNFLLRCVCSTNKRLQGVRSWN